MPNKLVADHICINGELQPGAAYKCRKCATAWATKYRQKYRERHRKEEMHRKKEKPNALRAKDKVRRAIKYGFLKRPKDLFCIDCKRPAQCYDHRNYLKPLDVEPVCFSCNKIRGSGINYK